MSVPNRAQWQELRDQTLEQLDRVKELVSGPPLDTEALDEITDIMRVINKNLSMCEKWITRLS